MISEEIKYKLVINWDWVPVNDDRADYGVGLSHVDGKVVQFFLDVIVRVIFGSLKMGKDSLMGGEEIK